MASGFEIRRFSLVANAWVPITVPMDCSKIVLQNEDASNGQAVRTNKDDPSTEKTIPAGIELTVQSIATAFTAGSVICWIKASAGSGPMVVSYTR